MCDIAGAAGRGLCSTAEVFPGAKGSRAQAAPSTLVWPQVLLFEHEIRNLERNSQPQRRFGRSPAELGSDPQGLEPLFGLFPQQYLVAVGTLLGHCHL